MSRNAAVEPFQAEAPLSTEDFRQDGLVGLSGPKKAPPCKYLYDDQGGRFCGNLGFLEEF